MRPTLLALSFALAACGATEASAQCCGAPAPTVAYSPVVAAPVAPVVQATTVSSGWYPGKYLTDFTRSVFGLNRTTTYTAGYAPAPYTAGYAPTAYTAGYAPAYSVGYAPTPYTAGYAPTYQTAYRPTYPATYGAVVQSVSRPVVLSPVVSAPACDACGGCGSCNACAGGVEQAYYAAAPSTGCSSCNAGASYSAPIQAAPQTQSPAYPEPRPALGPLENPAPERSIRTQRPDIDEFDSEFDDADYDDSIPTDPAAANEYWRAPPLFAPPSNRVTRRSHPAPAQVAVYRRAPETRRTAYRPTGEPTKTAPKVHRLSADGWGSAE